MRRTAWLSRNKRFGLHHAQLRWHRGSFVSASYTGGHNVIEIANGGATVRSPSHGAWEKIGGRKYGSTVIFFRYDPVSGAYLGTLKIRHELEVAEDGQSFTGVAIGELRDANGNLLPGSNTRKDTVTAERINVEPLPDLP